MAVEHPIASESSDALPESDVERKAEADFAVTSNRFLKRFILVWLLFSI